MTHERGGPGPCSREYYSSGLAPGSVGALIVVRGPQKRLLLAKQGELNQDLHAHNSRAAWECVGGTGEGVGGRGAIDTSSRG